MKTLIFEGYLQELLPNGLQVEATSAFEALSLLALQPGFRTEDDVRHRVILPDFRSQDSLYQKTDTEIILIVPVGKEVQDAEVFSGSGSKGFAVLEIIVGAVLIVAFWGSTSSLGVAMIGAGMSLMLSGVLGLLMPAPKKNDLSTDASSNYLAANKNTVAIGTPIPMLFGKRKVYGHLLSYNVTATNLGAVPPGATPANTSSGTGVDPLTQINYRGDWHDPSNP